MRGRRGEGGGFVVQKVHSVRWGRGGVGEREAVSGRDETKIHVSINKESSVILTAFAKFLIFLLLDFCKKQNFFPLQEFHKNAKITAFSFQLYSNVRHE
jgi:hypothetical protein